ncbi:ras guanine-nucleotide exchange protein-like protein [Calycina marina]|uniref:Ras guanine-nucleotide exchange protein-like protein n=1 Tax=Calycina marina TaxID=1763456 RepID=A0A9P8CCH2_9HELO|nr:ras guanine-nucleotide exchange protein-like protein [Calycina marina]
MVKESEQSTRESTHFIPLAIRRGPIHRSSPSLSSNHKRNESSRSRSSSIATGSSSQITPPTTPNGSQEDLTVRMAPSIQAPAFHNFLRAFYPFHPTYAAVDATVTLPLNEGDVILVHSIHTNGWADGTLLVSGARGWLPTNYCESYEPDAMRNLLKSLLQFWDLLRSELTPDPEVFGNQEFIRGIIAGVRFLLERSLCLTRESPRVLASDSIRRNRKALLSDLSSLVKTAKRLQENTMNQMAEDVNNAVDDMVLKAFKIATRGVRFLDALSEDSAGQHPANKAVMATVAEETNPPTPPAETTSFDATQHSDTASETASRRSSSRSTGSGVSRIQQPEEQTKQLSGYKRASVAYSSANSSSRPMSVAMSRPTSTIQSNSQSISHRVSMTHSIHAAQRQNLVTERLNASHDTFLSYLGSFIGRVHLQSQSSANLLLTIRQSVTAGRALLAVVAAVCEHDNQTAESLHESRNTMCDQINKLVVAARNIIESASVENEDIVLPHQNGQLLAAATGCVKAAGECVAKTKYVIERIGDFEFEPQGLGIDTASMGVVEEVKVVPKDAMQEPITRAPPLHVLQFKKPLPDVPLNSGEGLTASATVLTLATKVTAETASSMKSARAVNHSLLAPLPRTSQSSEEYNPSEMSHSYESEFQPSVRGASMTASNAGTYISSTRDSEFSLVSQTSTRATTPDMSGQTPIPKSKLSMYDLSTSEGQSTPAEPTDLDDGETKMLEKTYAHELLYNKEGQITGGSLPALVEKLTTHDSTPDAMFVATFYLTFRLFATPTELAKALVDRFEYVSESPHIAAPVRLRVYNAFKGWLESHWRDLSDHEALTIIEPFAKNQLGKVLPAAGKRVLQLAEKVSCADGPIVPRLVSSIGKTSTSSTPYVSADTPLPPSYMTRAQMNSLKSWKMGGGNPIILEFDPLEVARQLTIKEMNIFCAIMPDELLGSEWTKRTASTATNVRAMSTLSTDLSNLVADTILQHEDAKKRAMLIKHWIKIAHKCLELNNYDSLMAIICSLNSSTICRLKKTWDIVSARRKDLLKSLQAIVVSEKNYAVLRRRLHDHIPPCLPFVGTYLTDLTFVDAGNPPTKQIPGIGDDECMSVINFDKHSRTAKIIGELQRFQIPYRLTEVPELQEWLQAQIVRVKSSSENENVQQFYRKSLLLEPRENRAPVMPNILETKDKFDIFNWAHSNKDKECQASISASSSHYKVREISQFS